MEVPKMTYVMPLRTRLQFTFNALPSFLMHSSREHEVILVLDKCPGEYEFKRRKEVYPSPDITPNIEQDRAARETVYRWVDSHQKLLNEYKVKILDFHGDERCWTGGLRAAGAMNMGTAASTTDWVVAFGDEDLVFGQDWDVAMWNVLRGYDPMRYVATPVMVMPQVRTPFPEVTPAWIHGQRELCCHQLTYPIDVKHAEIASCRLLYANFLRFAEKAKMVGVREESCGDRTMCHWVPLVMHRRLFDRVGGYPVHDRAACSFDLVFDDSLRDVGVTKRMPLDHLILHGKHLVYFNDEVDRVWADSETVGRLGREAA